MKGVEALIEGRPEKALETVLWVLFMLLAAYSGPLGIYAMIERGKVKKGFQNMMSGTDANIMVYARALDEATPSVDEDSVKVYANPPPPPPPPTTNSRTQQAHRERARPDSGRAWDPRHAG